MAYASLVSVVQILEQLLHSDSFPVHYPNPQIESLYQNILSLQSSFEKVYPVPKKLRKSVNDLEIRIRNAMYSVQDTIENFIYRQIHSSQSEDIPGDPVSISLFLQETTKTIEAMAKSAEEIAALLRHSKEDPKTDPLSEETSNNTSSGKSNKIVGQEEDLNRMTVELLKEKSERQVIPITGSAGVGKTTLARSIYESKAIESHFYIRAWVTVSQEYYVRDIFLKLLGSMETKGQKSDASDSIKNLWDKVGQRTESQLIDDLFKSLFNKRYLVVIDDIWDEKVWDEIRNSFPDNKNGSRIVLTTRNADVTKYAKSHDFLHVMNPLSPEKSWELLCEKVFAGGECPLSLERIGRRIARDCGGHPLSITVDAGQLSERKTVEFWGRVEEDIHGVVDKDKETYSEILSLSYYHLPARTKGCFLYLGAFPEDSEIHVSKLVKLWVAEGFLPPPLLPLLHLEQVALECLKHLIDYCLLSVRKFSSNGQPKTCIMLGSVRELALRECQKQNFFHAWTGVPVKIQRVNGAYLFTTTSSCAFKVFPSV